MLSGSLLPKAKGSYIVTSPDVSSLHYLGLNTSNTPSKFKFNNFVYNYINVSSSDVSLNYNTSCINHSVILGEILFDTINDCQNFSVIVTYNETSKISSFLVRQNNLDFNLEPKLSITDTEVFSDYFPTSIFGGVAVNLNQSVRLIDPLGIVLDVTSYFDCEYFYVISGITLPYISMVNTTSVTITCNSTYHRKVSSFFLNSTDYININSLEVFSTNPDNDTIRTQIAIIIDQHMITRRNDGTFIPFITKQLNIPIEFKSVTSYTIQTQIGREEYFGGYGIQNPYTVFCRNNSYTDSEIVFLVENKRFGSKEKMYCNNLPSEPDIDLGYSSKQKYKITQDCDIYNCLVLNTVPVVSESIFFQYASINVCSLGAYIFDIVDNSSIYSIRVIEQ